jgi:hypothetical protein
VPGSNPVSVRDAVDGPLPLYSPGLVTDVSNPDGLSPYSNVTVVELKFG